MLSLEPMSAADVARPLFVLPVDVSRGIVPTMPDALYVAPPVPALVQAFTLPPLSPRPSSL